MIGPLSGLHARMWSVLDQLDVEEDDRRRADLIDEAIDLADRDPHAAAEWRAYR